MQYAIKNLGTILPERYDARYTAEVALRRRYGSNSYNTIVEIDEDKMQTLVKTTDLGGGWFANTYDDGCLTLRNPDKAQRIDLSAESVGTLRAILWTTADRDD